MQFYNTYPLYGCHEHNNVAVLYILYIGHISIADFSSVHAGRAIANGSITLPYGRHCLLHCNNFSGTHVSAYAMTAFSGIGSVSLVSVTGAT